MSLTRIIVLLLGSLLSQSYILRAQEVMSSDYHVKQYTDENGLPQNSVKAIMIDKNGFVWLSTEVGLTRFDGHKFLVFNKTSLALSSNRFAGFSPSLTKFDEQNMYEFYGKTELNDYVGIKANGLVGLDTAFYTNYLKISPVKPKSSKENMSLPSLPSLFPAVPSYESYVAASGRHEFFGWEGKKINFYKQGKKIYSANGLFRDFFLIGAKPFATTQHGEFVKIYPSSKPKIVDPEGDILENPSFVSWKNSYQLFWNNGSRKAFIYLDKCFYALEETRNGGLTTRLLLKDFDFEEFSITCADFDDKSGYLFLGSPAKGLFVIRKKDFQAVKMQEEDADNVYYSQITAVDQSIITAQGYKFETNVRSAEVPARTLTPFLKQLDYKFSLAAGRDGFFWAGVGDNLFKFNQNGELVIRLKTAQRFKSMYADRQNRLWLGGEKNLLFRLNGMDSILRYAVRAPFGEIINIHEQSAHKLLLATKKGLFRLDVRLGHLEQIRNFDGVIIRSFYSTSDGSWITTYGNGIYLLTKEKVVRFPLDKDGFLATAHCIVEDANGFFWITTNKGLFQVAKKQLLEYSKNSQLGVYYLYYDKNQGFETNEFNGGCDPCALRLANGLVSFPSMDGLVWFYPHKMKFALPNRNIFVSKIELDGKPIEVKNDLEISGGFEQLRLHVTTPYFGDENNIQMSYSLSESGRKPVWFPVSEDFVIPLSKLGSGTYELAIRKVNGFGAQNYTYKIIKIHVPPAWFETWWFWCLMIILVQGALLLVVRLRTRYLVNKEREDNLRRHYRIISQIVAAVNHDIQTPLHYVTYSLQQINGYLHRQSNTNELVLRMSDESLNTTHRIGALTKNLLNYVKLQSKNESSRSELTLVNVHELVGEVCKLFSAIAEFRTLRIINAVEPGFTVLSDRDLLSIVVHNLIDNALKVSDYEVIISSGSVNGNKQIVIEDTGDGMSKDLTAWLSKSYKSYDEWLRASAFPEQRGIGLVIVKDLCVLLSISLVPEARPGKGTAVHVVFDGTE
jgi:signal transduction histidine kinase